MDKTLKKAVAMIVFIFIFSLIIGFMNMIAIPTEEDLLSPWIWFVIISILFFCCLGVTKYIYNKFK